MSSNPYIKLKELCTVNQGLQIPISKRFKSDGNNRYFYITVQFLKVSHNEKYYVENPPKSSICNEDDIIVVRTGSTGQILTGIKGCFHNNFFRVNYDKEKVIGKYLYYCLKSKEKQKEMKNRSGITTIPDLNHFMFLDIKIPLANYFQQIGIVKTLDSINKKIEVNNKINTELEAMAKTLYDYWFVQFDFPDSTGKPYKTAGGKMVFNEELKREIPEGWESNLLGNLGNFKNGVNYDPSKPGNIACPIINVRNISKSRYFLKNEDLDIIYLKESDVRKYSVHLGSIIIARSGIPGATRLIADFEKNTLYCGFAIHYELENLEHKIPVFFYLKSIEELIKNGSGGTILKNVNQATLNNLKIVLPNSNMIINSFNKKINPIFSKINLIQRENQKLSELRDWLLPMLMNGQVTVGDVEEKLGMVAEPGASYESDKTSLDNLFEAAINYDFEIACIAYLTELNMNVRYGKKYLQKTLSNIQLLASVPKIDKIVFKEHYWGMYSDLIDTTIQRATHIEKAVTPDGKTVFKIKSSSKNKLKGWMKESANIEFVSEVNQMLSLYKQEPIKKRMNSIEQLNTVLECINILDTYNLEKIYAKMKKWKMQEGKYKFKSDKFSKVETKKMLGFIKGVKQA